MSELKRDVPFPPVMFALTCHPDQLAEEGFTLRDIGRLIDWKAGRLTDATPEEVRRFGQLESLVIVNAP